MASSDSNDRPRRRFLPSIRNVQNLSDECETSSVTTNVQKKDSDKRGGGSSRRSGLRGFRSFFTTDRSSSNVPVNPADDNARHTVKDLPSLSPQPAGPVLKVQYECNDGSHGNHPSDQRLRASSLRESGNKQLISVESKLQFITGESRSAPSTSCGSSRSCSPCSETEGGDLSKKRNVISVTKVCSLNGDVQVKGTRSPQLLSIDSSQMSNVNSSNVQHLRKSLSADSRTLEKEEKEVVMYTNSYDLKNDFKKAKASKNYSVIVNFLTTAFNSLSTLSSIFKASEYDKKCAINNNFVNITYDIIMALPSDHRKAILKSIVNCLLSNIKKKQDDKDLAGYLVLLQNPQFDNSSSYVIFSHLLRQVSSLSGRHHQTLVEWMEWLPITSFKDLINRLKQFVSVSLFPSEEEDLSSSEKMRFWVQSAVKVLALLNAANWLNNKPIVSYTYMYIDVLENINLVKEYDNWQARSGTFSFCQYPFLLSLTAKRYILQKDSESQMVEVARKSLIQGVKKREAPAINMLFLTLHVRRDHLMTDSLNEISRKRIDLKKKLKVTFVGEPGVDMGGLTKEWFMLLVRKVFRPEYGMFRYDDKSSCYWFTNMEFDDLSEFNLIGALMGLAVYNSTILDIRFPLCCYKKLLSPAVVPVGPNAVVGVTKLELSDLKEVMPELGRGLQELLSYEGNVEDDICQTFQVSSTVCGSVITENLKENGDSIAVTNKNRTEYVDLYVDYILNKSIYRQFAAFYRGFHSVCASNALIMLRPEEVEMLVCGNPDFDMRALCKVTTYDGFSKKDITIRYFWETVGNFSSSLKRKLLRFCTGSDRTPVGGMAEMEFKITRMASASDEMLPMAHTCFNQLCLPPYKSRQTLKSKLIIAVSNSEGFGIE